MSNNPLPKNLLGYFNIPVEMATVKPFGSGHINDTYLVEWKSEFNLHQYLLQRINHLVFPKVKELMENTLLVTEWINEKIKAEPRRYDFEPVSVVKTKTNEPFVKDESGNYWRLMSYLPDSFSLDVATNSELAFQAGKAFGQFQRILGDLSTEKLHYTIPKFHDMAFRFSNFENAQAVNHDLRKETCEAEIDFVISRKNFMLEADHQIKNGFFPFRVTHNDTKLNNLLFRKSKPEAIAVIDLDTVMPGVVLFDFGDAIRTITNTANEDEEDTSKIQFDMRLFKGFTEGFLKETRDVLTESEIESLGNAGQYMTFIMGLRFLTDYLAGDVYYKVKDGEHNLRRAKAQFQLLRLMENDQSNCFDIVQHVIKSN